MLEFQDGMAEQMVDLRMKDNSSLGPCRLAKVAEDRPQRVFGDDPEG